MHQFQLRTTLQFDNDLAVEPSFLTMTAPAFSTTVSNLISFELWNDSLVGANPALRARCVLFPAIWDIDIYDADSQWVTTLSGSTADGHISTPWNFRDAGGNLRDDLDYDPFFFSVVTVAPTGGGAPQSSVAPTMATDYPKLGKWLFAYQDSDKQTPQTRQTISGAVAALVGGPSARGIPFSYQPMAYGRDVDTNPATAQALRNYGWYQFASYLFNPAWQHRNLYYMGHGTEFWIGGDFDYVTNGVIVGSQINRETYVIGTNVISSKASIPASAVRNGLSYDPLYGPRRYRFVFLDGCATAKQDFPFAFGFAGETNTLADYQNPQKNLKGYRPSAFVGWNEPIGYVTRLGQHYGEWGDYQQYANFRTSWMFNWEANSTTTELMDALDEGRKSGWISSQTFGRIIRVFGYQELRFNDYNRRENWQWPPP